MRREAKRQLRDMVLAWCTYGRRSGRRWSGLLGSLLQSKQMEEEVQIAQRHQRTSKGRGEEKSVPLEDNSS
jgi:hypothetical protein